MTNTWSRLRGRLAGGAPILAGIIAGGIGLVISFAGRGITPGRVLGDPLPLALSAGQIARGLLCLVSDSRAG